jgi:hypothetical protein
MMAKMALVFDGNATMTVRTSDLTLGDLAFDGRDRVFLVGLPGRPPFRVEPPRSCP